MHLERAYCVWSILWLYKAGLNLTFSETSKTVIVAGRPINYVITFTLNVYIYIFKASLYVVFRFLDFCNRS